MAVDEFSTKVGTGGLECARKVESGDLRQENGNRLGLGLSSMGGSRERVYINRATPTETPALGSRPWGGQRHPSHGIRPYPKDPRPIRWSRTALAGVLVLVNLKGYRDAP